MRTLNYTLLAMLMLVCLPLTAMTAEIPQLKAPVLLTSLGQSPDANTLSVLASRANLDADFETLANEQDVVAYKTVLITVGTSLKGFGSAGVNLDTEVARCGKLVKAAKENGVYIILVHIGGEGRRDNMTNLLLDELAPNADAFLVYDSGNKDEYFNKVAGSKPLVLVPRTIEVINVLKSIRPE